MRIAVLICCLAFAVADRPTSKRGIGAEAFASPQSQDTGPVINLQEIVAANQLGSQSVGLPDQYLSGYQSDYLGQHGGFGLTALGGGYAQIPSQIPPQVAPQQKPAQLALAAAAAVAQQNFGHPAYGAPPRQDPQAAILQNINNQQYAQLPQYREYNQQLQNYAQQPIALNYGNTQIRAFPPPSRPAQRPPVRTFQAYGQGQQAPVGQAYYGSAQQSLDLFRAAPAQVLPEAPQPTAIPYASQQPQVAFQYAAPQPVALQYAAPSYGLESAKSPSGAYSYASFASGGQLTTSSGFRPIHPQ